MNELEERFRGVVLTTKQRQTLKDSMRSVLGEEFYALTESLFNYAQNAKARFVVFLARRCFNLMNLYYRANFQKPDENYERRVLSDSGLLANVPLFAYRYAVFSTIPNILIADDILIHGRGINNLIDKFIDSLKKYLFNIGFDISREVLERDVLKSITIKVMVQNNKPLLMKSAYYQRLITDEHQNIWEPRRWHELSSRISRLMSESIFSNTSFTFSLFNIANTDAKGIVEDAAYKLGFIKSGWNKRFISDAWVKPLKKSNGDIVAFYTLRITQNMTDKSFCLVPFVFASDIDMEISKLLFKKIFGKEIGGAIFESSFSDKVSAEFIYLTLSYNLLLLIQEECHAKNLVNIAKLDLDKILLNFGKDTIFSNAIDILLDFRTPFLSWEKMNMYLLSATYISDPLICSNYERKTVIYHDISEALEETVAYEGEEIERIAYLEYSGQKSISKKSKLKPIHSLFSKIESQTNLSNDNDVADLVGNFLRQMDRGYVAVTTKIMDHDGSQQLSCVYRAAEVSQFIHSKKYSDYLPVLIEMEKDCSFNCERIVDRIDHFYEEKPELKTKLEKYTRALYDSGQKLMDWDINWLHWTEIDDDTVRRFGNLNQEDLIISQMIMKSLDNIEELKRYRALYPRR